MAVRQPDITTTVTDGSELARRQHHHFTCKSDQRVRTKPSGMATTTIVTDVITAFTIHLDGTSGTHTTRTQSHQTSQHDMLGYLH